MKYNLEQLLSIAKKTQQELVLKKKPLEKPKEDTTIYFKFLKRHKISPGKDTIWKHYLETWFESDHDGPFKPRSFNRILKLRIKKNLGSGRTYFVDMKSLYPSRYERNKSILKWLLKRVEDGEDKKEKSTKP